MSKIAIPEFYSFADSARYHSRTVAVHCPNPKHYDNSPSCVFHAEDGNFSCQSCGVKGQLINFVQLAEQKIFKKEIDEWQALCKIARIINDKLTQEEIDQIQQFTGFEYIPSHFKSNRIINLTPQEALDRAKRFFNSVPQTQWNHIRFHYMQDERRFPSSSLQKSCIRLNSSSCWPILIPIKQQNEFMGYMSRLARDPKEGESKYKNNTGFQKSSVVGGNLFHGTVLLVEGWLDLMRAILYGFPNVACTFGWYCSDEQARHIRQFADGIIVGYDNDKKGQQGYQRVKTCFEGLSIYRMEFPDNVKDVDMMEEQWFNVQLMKSGLKTISTAYEGERSCRIPEIISGTSRDTFIQQQVYEQIETMQLPYAAKEERVFELCH